MAVAMSITHNLKYAGHFGLIFFTLIIVLTVPAFANKESDGMIIISGYDVNLTPAELERVDMGRMDGQVSFFELPLWIQVSYISVSIGTILGSLIIFPAIARKVKDTLTNKESIINFITKNPGCISSHIITNEEIPKGTVRYHLVKLKSEGRIVLKRMGKSLRIFVCSRALSDKEKIVAAYMSNERDKKILLNMCECEGSTNQYLSNKLNMNKSAIYKRLKKYVENGIVQYRQDGRNKKYFVDAEVKEFIVKRQK